MCRCSSLGVEFSGILCDCHRLSRYCKLCCRECRNENKSQICGKICVHFTPANIHLFVQPRPTCGGNSLRVGVLNPNCWNFLANSKVVFKRLALGQAKCYYRAMQSLADGISCSGRHFQSSRHRSWSRSDFHLTSEFWTHERQS